MNVTNTRAMLTLVMQMCGESDEGSLSVVDHGGYTSRVDFVYWIDRAGDNLLEVKLYEGKELVTFRAGEPVWVIKTLKDWLMEE